MNNTVNFDELALALVLRSSISHHVNAAKHSAELLYKKEGQSIIDRLSGIDVELMVTSKTILDSLSSENKDALVKRSVELAILLEKNKWVK